MECFKSNLSYLICSAVCCGPWQKGRRQGAQ